MIKPCAKITLDIQQPSTATFVALKKRDIGRKIIISLSDGGFPYEIADDCYAVLTAKKPDNKTLYNHCEIDGNTIVYEITEQTTAAAGRMKAEVKLYGADDTLITSATFRIIIDGTVYDEGEVESTSEFSALTELIVKVTELLNSGDLIGEDGYSIFLTSYELPFVADGGGGSIALNTSSISLTEIQTQGKTVKAGDLVISENGVVGSVTAVSAGKASVKSVVNIVSPHVGDNGNWYVGTIDTGVSAKGEDGISTSLTVKYGVSDSSTESPGEWVEAFPILTESYPYLWMQVTLTASSGTATSDCGVIGVYGSAKQQGFDVPATKNLNMGGKAINGINYASFNDAGGDPDGGTYMVSEDVIYDEEGHVAGQVFGFYGSCGDEPVVLRNIHTPLKDGDAANKEYVDQAVANSGGNVDQVSVEPADDDIPKVFLTGSEFGNMTAAKNEVKMGLEYISKTDKFKAAIKIKFQGNTSLTFPKKNFTIKMYTDDTYEDKLKKSFKNWNHSGNKYVLKANWIDHAHARNIISARLWGEVVASRTDYDSLPVEMRNAPNNGAIDGFPVKLYVNGTYEGVYTWNVGKDDWMWGMDEDNANHVLMCAETNNDGATTNTPCNFRALWSGTDENHWTVEVGTNSTALKTSLNNLIQFVMDNDGDAFRNGIGNYLDIQSAIDYYIFQYEICGLDGLAKNLLLATYDGKKWICGAYDMDATFGLYWNGSKFVSAEYRCPEDYQETYSLLWERIEANFSAELKARQAELRNTVLSYSNMVTHFERFMDVIGLDLYAEDLTIYQTIPSSSTNNIKQIRDYIRDRQSYVDAEFAAMSAPVPCTGIYLSANTLTFTAEGTQTLTATVTPEGCTEPVTWESNNTSVATVNGGVVTAIANGSATITAKCGGYSASCSVAVSGITEAKPCTGITLDKTELSINGKGTQTITATVEPADTTDTIVWSSNNQRIATVSDGVVTPLADGNCIITATCGEYSASCSVAVSGVSENVLNGVSFESGYIANDTGIPVSNSGSESYSSVIPLSDYAGDTILITGSNATNVSNANRIHLYEADGTQLSWTGINTLIDVPEGTEYGRLTIAVSKGSNVAIHFALNSGSEVMSTEGKLTDKNYGWADGNLTAMSGWCTAKIPVKPDALYLGTGVTSVAYLDGDNVYLSGKMVGSYVDGEISTEYFCTPENCEFIYVNWKTANEQSLSVIEPALIGYFNGTV